MTPRWRGGAVVGAHYWWASPEYYCIYLYQRRQEKWNRNLPEVIWKSKRNLLAMPELKYVNSMQKEGKEPGNPRFAKQITFKSQWLCPKFAWSMSVKLRLQRTKEFCMPHPNASYPHVKTMTIRKDKSWGPCREAIMKQEAPGLRGKGPKKDLNWKMNLFAQQQRKHPIPSSGIFLYGATWIRDPFLVPPLQQAASPTCTQGKDQFLPMFIPTAQFNACTLKNS